MLRSLELYFKTLLNSSFPFLIVATKVEVKERILFNMLRPTIVVSINNDSLDSSLKNDGNALKAIGQGTGNGAGTNASGFSALLAGKRSDFSGTFIRLHEQTTFWASEEWDNAYAKGLGLDNNTNNLYETVYSGKRYGFSVRCLKD